MTDKKKFRRAAGAATTGAIVGGTVIAVVGDMGLALGGTAVGIGAGTAVLAGALTGLGVYGVYKLFSKRPARD